MHAQYSAKGNHDDRIQKWPKKMPDNDLINEVVGMSNTDGGIIYLGVEDDGEITGVHKQHADESGI